LPFSYDEHAPPPALARAVRCFWSLTGAPDAGEGPALNRILPDNCIDVIFDLANVRGPNAFIVGPMLTAAVMLHDATVDMLGVRFAPGAATEFLDLRATDLAPADIDASDVWPDAPLIAEQLASLSRTERLARFAQYLTTRRRANREAALAMSTAVLIERARGAISVASLARLLSTGERRLQRTFDAAVGIGPKQVIRVARFREAAAKLSQPGEISLSRIALDCGYADQAHFTREFVLLAGVTPTEFRREKRLV